MRIYAGIRTETLGKDPGHGGGGQEGRGIKHVRYGSGRDRYTGGRKIQHGGGRERYPVFEEIKQNKMCEMTEENRRLCTGIKNFKPKSRFAAVINVYQATWSHFYHI